MNIAVFASGNGSNFEAIAKTKFKKIKIKLLITDKENAYCIERSKKLNIPYSVFPFKSFKTKKEYEESILKKLKDDNIDFIVLAGYMRILEDTILDAYENKIINIHPSLLPAFKGRHAIEEAYNAKVKIIGITIHYVNKELDSGEIIAQECFKIKKLSLAETEAKIHKIEHKLYPKVLKELFE
ncbi:MAG: phosphoribosylglycinamide formyltransferase [Bacilli bacterium]|nr:phosphoribosylglycinamide formyltransferase [Bacilli bacterium]